jgi:DNA-binding transcriptional MerR regulator
MTESVITPNIRIGDAAASIGMETKALRNWFSNGHVKMLDARESAKGWRAFSFADVAWLAIMREFVRFGVGISDAESFAGALISEAHGHRLELAQRLEPDLFEAMFDGWRAVLYYLSDGEPHVLPIPQQLRAEMPPVRTSGLILNLRQIIADAFDALEARGYDIGRGARTEVNSHAKAVA